MKLFTAPPEPNKPLLKNAILLVPLGLLGLWTAAVVVWNLIMNYQAMSWWAALVDGFFLIAFTPMSVAAVLYPFKINPTVNRTIHLLLIPTEIVIVIGDYYQLITAPFVVFILLWLSTMFIWRILEVTVIASSIGVENSMYGSLMLAIAGFTLWGERLVEKFIIKERRQQYARYTSVLAPPYVRFGVYVLMAVSYLIANTERFSGHSIIPWPAWITYKAVLVEVFLTYVAFDAAITAWRDLKGKRPEQQTPGQPG